MSLLNYQSALYQPPTAPVAGVAQASMPLQAGATQLCAQADPFQQALIVCPPAFQGECLLSDWTLQKLECLLFHVV